MRFPLPTFCLSAGILLFGAGCASVDDERAQLRFALDQASALAGEVQMWSRARDSGRPAAVPAEIIESIEAFQARAEDVKDRIAGLSQEALQGTDLAAVDHALTNMIDFDTGLIEDASQDARASLLEQFAGLARNLERAVAAADGSVPR